MEVREKVEELLKKYLRPEFLNRIDERIVFAPLDQIDMHRIVRIQLDELVNKLKDMGVTLAFTDEAVLYLGKKGFDPQFGARPVKRVILKEVINALSKAILANEVARNSSILVDASATGIRFENQETVESVQ